MLKNVLSLVFLFFVGQLSAQELSYYLPAGTTYNTAIPEPKTIIHHDVGEWHVTHDRLVNYMQALAAAAPGRIKLETMGFSYEQRPQVLLIITSRANHAKLEEIRQEHLLLSDPARSAPVNIANMPLVVYIGHSIHGNESSGSNAALLTAYHLAAAQGKEMDEMLENVVILLDPSFNPDGLQRFSTWANQHKSKNLVTDPASREFNEVWPGGRYNHYWFDLNRDWLPAIHPESQNRVKLYHRWKPNILTDHHEQESNASFFFQPGVPSRVNPLTPKRNQELTGMLGRYHAKALDKIGSLYFSKENYDDFYYGKGSTFPDINGAIGILFEQGSSRGHAQQTSNGILRFPATIRNQFVTALSTLEGAVALRKEFLTFQRDFYKASVSATNNGYLFGDKYDRAKTFHFIEMLQRHGIAVNEYQGNTDGEFEKGAAYTVSLNQPQQGLIKGIFDKQLVFADSLFYDITSWTMPLAFGLPYKEITNINPGKKLENQTMPVGRLVGNQSDYAYLFEWDELYAPRALYELQQAGLITKVASSKSTVTTNTGAKQFDYGSILIPVKMQTMPADKVFSFLADVAKRNAIDIYSIESGFASNGIDLGSRKFLPLTQPTIAMLSGAGVSALDAGEVWHLLDQRMNIPCTHLDISVFNRADLAKYNTIIMVSGTYPDLNKEKLRAWVQAGGVLILEEDAVSWAVQNGINNVSLKKIKSPVDSGQRLPYVEREQIEGGQQMNGAIFGAAADLSHPLAYGYNQKTVNLFKANRIVMEKSKNPYATPFYYGNNALQSGYASTQNLDAIKNSAAVIVNTIGSGRVINIADNPNLRGFWLGGTKLMMNAIFFGRIIDAASGRAE
jgi:hypothetical protein